MVKRICSRPAKRLNFIGAFLKRLEVTLLLKGAAGMGVKLKNIEAAKRQIRAGRLVIDFDILVGDLTSSEYQHDQIEINWLHEPFKPAEPVAQAVVRRLAKLKEKAKKEGRIFDETIPARLCSYHVDGKKIQLTLQPTEYFLFAVTNLALDEPMIPDPRGNGSISIRKLAGSELFSLPSPFLANPLNVIAMILTKDGFTFVPKRSSLVYERPNTWQASVGGGVNYQEHPALALVREVREEWGLDIELSELRFLALGINRRTGEPDLLALVESKANSNDVLEKFHRGSDKLEFRQFDRLRMSPENLPSHVSALCTKDWSQPSDQTAFLLALIRRFGLNPVAAALEELRG